MTRKITLLTFVLATAIPTWAGRPSCNDVPLRLIVAPQTPGLGGISGDGASIYNNPNNPNDPFNGGTLYEDGAGGVYVEFQVCNGTNDFVLNLRNTSSPVRYLELDFSVQLAPPNTAAGAIDLTGKTIHQQGQQINEMANTVALSDTNGQTCSGFMLDSLSQTVTGGNAWFKPPTIYDPVVPDCTSGTAPDLANQPVNASDVQITPIDACTWTVSPVSTGAGLYRVGVAEVMKVSRKSTSVAGGQFQMPFSYEIQKLNCTP
jgi:hypothetical protein